MNLIEAIQKFKQQSKRLLFTTPGHCQGIVIPKKVKELLGSEVFKSDLSEIDGFDNIRSPQDLFLESQTKAAQIYNAKNSFYLFNGSSSGVLALMLTTIKPKDKVLIARNSHVSVYNSLVLSGAVPIWLNTDWLDEWNIPGAANPESIEKILDKNPDIKSVWVTSPTYHGVVSNISKISEICKKRKTLLIVDEAHGALWNFNDRLPVPAIKAGADASVQSLHKTSVALNQGAILHISKTSPINPEKVQNCLNLVNSTSPSYPILASVEGAVEFMDSREGQAKLDELLYNIDDFRQKLSKIDNIQLLISHKTLQIDETKLVISVNGLTGYKLSEKLSEKYDIEDELAAEKTVLAITGLGTTKSKLDKLKDVLIEIVENTPVKSNKEIIYRLIEPEMVYTPREAFFADKIEIPVQNCVGKICGELILPYPPGIPVLFPGERIKKEHLPFLSGKERIFVI